MMSSKRTERRWWWRSSKLASVVSLIHCFPVFPTLSSALQQLNPHLQLFLSNLISFWRLPFSFPSNRCMFDCQKMQKKGPTVNKFKALVRYEQVYGNLEYRIVCLKTILATPSGLNSASFELETYDQAMTNRVFFTSGRVWLKRPGLGSGWGIVYWGSGYLSVHFVSIEADLSHWFVCEILFLIEFLNVISSHLTS